ncbi:hypothetical protein [Hymenobacter lapidiphilus]|uniref:Uncharacterized protein n=1 Tax=Hymenobacter lapidiphilus TaxID=2608003 RepID=A0A7Y7PSZ5_9BACT|nr:hypothetical protein [Hymenobacter lapidiphilus]NVO33475.1 hypothetical protein [Hymenobacter lapidiphilus]
MNMLSTLGLATMQPTAPVSSLALSARPVPSRTRRLANLLIAPRLRPSEHPDPAVQHQAAGLITLLSAGIVMVDSSTRQLEKMGLFKFAAIQALKMLMKQADKLLSATQDKFDAEDSDATNYVCQALELVTARFCQLTPAQMDASLRHMDEMIRLNLAYVPAPTPTAATLT